MKWHCPYCRREMEIGSLDELPHMPFCSQRCLMADLNGWLSGHYVISRPIEEGDLGEAASSTRRSTRRNAARTGAAHSRFRFARDMPPHIMSPATRPPRPGATPRPNASA